MKYGVPVHVRSSFSDVPGTWVVGEEKSLESIVVTGVAYDKGEARVMLVGVDDKPGVVAKIFGALADQHIAVDMIIQSPSRSRSGPRLASDAPPPSPRRAAGHDVPKVDVTFTVNKADLARTKVI